MKYYELCDLNFLWENISRMVDELQDDKTIQIVLETWNEEKYWLISHNVVDNSIPMITWCCNDEPENEDISCRSWQELKECIFELMTSDAAANCSELAIVNYYTESI